MDQKASENFGAYIGMLVSFLVSPNHDEHLKSYAAAEILRQLDSSSKFIVNIQKGKWAAVPAAGKTSIIESVCIHFPKLLQYRHILHLILREFYSYSAYCHRPACHPI